MTNAGHLYSYLIPETIRLQSERMMGALFEESLAPVAPLVPSIPMAAPDTGFVNMIQTGEEAMMDQSHASIHPINQSEVAILNNN